MRFANLYSMEETLCKGKKKKMWSVQVNSTLNKAYLIADVLRAILVHLCLMEYNESASSPSLVLPSHSVPMPNNIKTCLEV